MDYCLRLCSSSPGCHLQAAVLFKSSAYYGYVRHRIRRVPRMTAEPLVLAGDFNIHVNIMTDNDAAQFLDLLSSIGLHQHIDFPTHTSGNTLGLLISRTLNSNLIQDVRPGTYFSDHCLALFTINISVPQLSRKKVSFRKTKAIDITAFMEDLSASRLCQDPPSEPVKLVDCYNTTLAGLLDRHAPLKTKTVTVNPKYLGTRRKSVRLRERADLPKGNGELPGLSLILFHSNDTKTMLHIC